MTDLDYHALQDAIPTLDLILTTALHDRRRGDSDRDVYRHVCDAVAVSGACYKTQRMALNLIRGELNIPDSIEDVTVRPTQSNQDASYCRHQPPPRDEMGMSGIPIPPKRAEGATAPISREAA